MMLNSFTIWINIQSPWNFADEGVAKLYQTVGTTLNESESSQTRAKWKIQEEFSQKRSPTQPTSKSGHSGRFYVKTITVIYAVLETQIQILRESVQQSRRTHFP